MRLAGINSSRGSVIVLFVAALPLMVAALIVIVEIGRIAVARARLQSAADRAVFAGAASLADSMNSLAASNWRINKSYRDLEEEFNSSSEQNEEAVRQRIEKYEATRDSALEDMSEVLSNMHERSETVAESAFEANYPSASAGFELSGDVRIDEELDRAKQWGELGYNRITGDVFVDPEDVSSGQYAAL